MATASSMGCPAVIQSYNSFHETFRPCLASDYSSRVPPPPRLHFVLLFCGKTYADFLPTVCPYQRHYFFVLLCFTVVLSVMILETVTNQDLPVIKCVLISHENNGSSAGKPSSYRMVK
jgi:hypothetical protein